MACLIIFIIVFLTIKYPPNTINKATTASAPDTKKLSGAIPKKLTISSRNNINLTPDYFKFNLILLCPCSNAIKQQNKKNTAIRRYFNCNLNFSNLINQVSQNLTL